MGDFKMGSKTVMSQSGTSNPTWGANAPTGCIINVTSTSITRASSQFTSTSFTDIADDQSNALSVSVTPKTNSKILLMATLMTSGTNYNIYLRFMRDSTAIGINTNPSNRPAATMSTYGSEGATYETMSTSMQFLDTTPGGDGSTSIVYKIQLRVQSSGSAYINRSERHTDEAHRDGTGISTITAMEIAG